MDQVTLSIPVGPDTYNAIAAILLNHFLRSHFIAACTVGSSSGFS